MREVVNLFELELQRDDDDPPGYAIGYRRTRDLLGATRLGASVFDLDEGQSVCPYHYEYGREEWLFVLTGTPTLRTPEGERELRAGDVVCFREGPEGAHKVTNRRPGTARIVMLSNTDDPSVAGYPDSGKIGMWPPGKVYREDDAVDYFEGELE